MKTIFFTITFCLTSFISLHAQNIFVLNDGKSVEYKKYKIDKEKEAVTIKKPEPAEIKIADINYLVNSLGEIYYLKELPPSDSSATNANSQKKSYGEMSKTLEGTITIFSHEVCYNTPGVGAIPSTTICYNDQYIEKDDDFEYLTFDLFSNLTNDINSLDKYFLDDKEIFDSLMSESFKVNKNNLYELIKEYNLRAHDRKEPPTKNEFCNALFYRSFSGENKDLVAEIDLEGEHISMPYSSYQLVRLYDDKPMKICINNGVNKHYELVSGSKYIIKYYNIRLKNSGEVELELKNKKDFQRYLDMVRK